MPVPRAELARETAYGLLFHAFPPPGSITKAQRETRLDMLTQAVWELMPHESGRQAVVDWSCALRQEISRHLGKGHWPTVREVHEASERLQSRQRETVERRAAEPHHPRWSESYEHPGIPWFMAEAERLTRALGAWPPWATGPHYREAARRLATTETERKRLIALGADFLRRSG